MSIQHHCNDETLMAYAAGTLGEAMSLVVATHLSLCGHCRDRVDLAQSIGGALLEEAEDAPLSTGSLDRMLARLDEPEEDIDDEEENAQARAADVPAPLNNYLPDDLSSLKWRRLGGGVHTVNLETGGRQTAKLLRIEPGVKIPAHGHKGSELTLILKGAYRDELGRFGAGDVADMDSDAHHQPVAETDEDCICLIAMDAPLRFDNPALRLLRPLIGM